MSIQHERKMQAAFFDAIKYMKEIRGATIGIEHGVRLSGTPTQRAIQANNLKKQGVRAGTPDVLCFKKNKQHQTLWIEFKYGKNKQSPAQKEFEEEVKKEGHLYHICYSVEDALEILLKHCRG